MTDIVAKKFISYFRYYKYVNEFTEEQLKNKEIMYEFIKHNPQHYKELNSELKKDKDIALCALRGDSDNFYNLDYELINDREFIKKLIRNIGLHSFAFASNNLRRDKEFVFELMEEFGYKVAKYSSKSLKFNEDMLSILIPKILEENNSQNHIKRKHITANEVIEYLTPKKQLKKQIRQSGNIEIIDDRMKIINNIIQEMENNPTSFQETEKHLVK